MKVVIVNTRGIYGGTLILSFLSSLLNSHDINAKVFFVREFPTKNTSMFMFWKRWLIYSCKHWIKCFIYRLFKDKSALLFNIDYFKNYPIKNLREKYLPFIFDKSTVVIYPEVVYGNFLHTNNVVRWLLYYNKWNSTDAAFRNTDLFVCFRKIFNDWKLNPQGHTLTINFFDHTTYRKYNFNTRFGNCYILRKGIDRNDLPERFDGPVIHYGMSENEIVDIFNNSRYCYSYDVQTFYTAIAAVCGCIPIVVLEKGKNKSHYIGDDEFQPLGVAYGDSKSEIEYAIASRQKLIDSLDFDDANRKNIDEFISLLRQKFSTI